MQIATSYLAGRDFCYEPSQAFVYCNFVFILGCACLVFAAGGVPENPENLADTTGIPAVAIYVVVLQGMGAVTVLMTGLGIIFPTNYRASSFRVKVAVFIISNFLFVLTSLLAILIACSYLLGTLRGVVGLALNLIVIVLVVTSVPRREKGLSQ